MGAHPAECSKSHKPHDAQTLGLKPLKVSASSRGGREGAAHPSNLKHRRTEPVGAPRPLATLRGEGERAGMEPDT